MSSATLSPQACPLSHRSYLGPLFFNNSIPNRKHLCGSPLSISSRAQLSIVLREYICFSSPNIKVDSLEMYMLRVQQRQPPFADVKRLWTGWLVHHGLAHALSRSPWDPCTKPPSTVGLMDKRNDKSGRTLQLRAFNFPLTTFNRKTS